MANRRPQNTGRRMEFNRNDRAKNFGRTGVSPWQGGGPGSALPNLLPLSGGSTEATLALASNIINLLQPRQNAVPSLLDMPIRRDFGPDLGRYDRYGPNRMGNQGNFRRTGNYNRAGERISTNRKPFRPNDGQRQQNKSSPKKDDPKTKPVKESGEEGKAEKEGESSSKTENKDEEKKETPKTRYDDINSQLLKCHICNKSMWDGRSFENHLSGRAHAIMMQKTAESYALTADTMRQEFKIREMKRTRKNGLQPARDFYCAMCDMYAADGAIHRTTVGHRKLKKYLHPTCTCCHKEMPTRIELDEHRLTAEHLRNMQDKQEVVTKPKPEVMVISTLSMEQSYLREDRQRRPPRDDDKKNKEEGEKKDKTEESSEQQEPMESDEGKQEETEVKKETENEIDNENTIVDYKDGDDLTNLTQLNLPAYSTERGVGRSFLSEFRCVQCKLCRKLLDSESTAEVHLRTWRHHQLFVRLLGEKSGRLQNQPTEAKQDTQQEGNKRPHNSEESGNWKRRKTTPDLDDDNDDHNGHEDDIVMKEEPRGNDNETETPIEMPADDVLEDWEQSVDEILQDERFPNEEQEEQPAEVEEEVKPEEEEKPKEEKPKTEIKKDEKEKVVESPKPSSPAVGSPRGRGRGRGRGRRY